MKEDFIIRIKSRSEQFEHTQPIRVDEDDRIELMTYGSFVKKGDTYYITYKETETIGFAGCTTTIKIAADGSRVGLLRFGPANAQLIIERDRRSICHYETEVGSLTLGVTGDGIECSLTDSAICWMPTTPSPSSTATRWKFPCKSQIKAVHPLRPCFRVQGFSRLRKALLLLESWMRSGLRGSARERIKQ